MSDLPSLPALPATASATGNADATAHDHALGGDLAATHDSLAAGVTGSGSGHSAGAGAHASADGASASASADGHSVGVDTAADAAGGLPELALPDLPGQVGGIFELGAEAAVHQMVSLVLNLRAMFEGALPL